MFPQISASIFLFSKILRTEKNTNQARQKVVENSIRNIPKLKPYVAIRALLTMIIPTEVTTLNIHDAASIDAFLSAFPAEDIFIYCFQSVTRSFTALSSWKQLLYLNIKTNRFVCIGKQVLYVESKKKNTFFVLKETNKKHIL